MKDKKQILLAVLVLMMVIAPGGPGCKDFGIPDYTITVTVDDGIVGSPEAGSYVHPALTEIPYEYNHFENKNIPVVIKLNERVGSNEGQIIIYNNLEVHAHFFEIHQEWKFTLTNTEGTENEINITFEGESFTDGTFFDSRLGDDGSGRGTWKIRSYLIQLTFDNWEQYVLTSSDTSPLPLMSGTWTNGEENMGVWTAEPVN